MTDGAHPFLRTLSRRSVVRGAAWLLAAPVLGAFASLLSRHSRASRRPRTLSIPPDRLDTVTFVDDVIVCRGDGTVKVFAARCTHLGCRITQLSGDLLVCPCHGSKFRIDGSVASGPALRPLDVLAHESDPRTGVVTVHVS